MSSAHPHAPTLAWLLTALTCLLAGMAIVESRHQVVVLPMVTPVDVGETVGLAGQPPTTPAPAPDPEHMVALSSALLVEGVSVGLSIDPVLLRVERLTIPPRAEFSSEAASGPMLLLVETGALSVPGDSVSWAELGHVFAPPDTVLRHGQRLYVASGERYVVRNDDPAPAVALVVTFVPVATDEQIARSSACRSTRPAGVVCRETPVSREEPEAR